ncbi:MAG: rod shape-determining protein RodA [Gammaproteobacteria bacterium]|nr:rod shape-determining protein RodA [Gammaproteobacteria bacterium]
MIDGGSNNQSRTWQRYHLDLPLLIGLFSLALMGLVILYSAGSQNGDLILRQVLRLGVGFAAMFAVAQITPQQLSRWSIWIFGVGTLLLILVLLTGEVGKGAQRWLDLGLVRFQPSEIMKLAVPLMLARFMATSPMPPSFKTVIVGAILIGIPTFLIMKQPDLGTSLLIASSGLFVLLFAGLRWRYVTAVLGAVVVAAPFIWNLLHTYQKNRVLTFLDPERDPLGTGYHIIQSKIAIGSGGLYGKGWLNGTQSHLDFLPERTTDFIFAVASEEFGLLGVLLLLTAYLFIVLRGIYIAIQAQDSFSRLLAGSLTMTFFVYFFVNIAMVSGLLPVVGLPLPLVSYGGTSMVTLLASFGILMSIQTNRKLVAT